MSSSKTSDKWNIISSLVQKVGKDILKCIFDTMYYKSSSNNGTCTMRDWFKNNEISNKFLKKCRLKLSDAFLDKSPKESIFQWTDYFILIEKVNKSMYDQHFPDDHEFRIFLRKLKTFFEKVDHQDHAHFDNEFSSIKVFVTEFKKVCINLLNFIETELGLDNYTQVILKSLNSKIKNVTDGKLTSFKPSIKKFLDSALKEACYSKLTFYNFSNTSPLVVGLSEALNCSKPIFDNQFVNPHLSYRGQTFNTEDLFTYMKSEESNHSPLIIHGTGGSGKSTICYKIFDEWCELKSKTKTLTTTKFCNDDIMSFDLVILLQLNIHGSKDLYSIILNEIFPNSCKKCNISLKELKEFFLKSKILFILDGFDETKEKNLTSNVSDLFGNNKHIRIIITSRGDKLQDAMNAMKCFDAKPIQLHGLEEGERNVYINGLVSKLKGNDQSKIKDIEKKEVEFEKFLKSRKNLLYNLLNLPLIINLMFLLWFQPDSKLNYLIQIDTATKLFEEITKMMSKTIAFKYNLEIDIVMSTLKIFYFCTYKQLFDEDFETGVSKRSTDKIKKHIEKDLKGKVSPEYHKRFFSGLTISYSDRKYGKVDASAPVYYYFHKTQMEYLSAEYMAASSENFHKITENFCNHVDPYRFEQILPFVAGVYSNNDELDAQSGNLMSLISDEGNYPFLWRILSETNHENHNIDKISCKKSFCTKLAAKLRNAWNLTVENIIPAFKLLQHCDISHLRFININLSSDFNDDMEKEVLSILSADLSSTLCDRYRKNPITVELNLIGHCVGSNKSDVYLKYFKGWSSLLHFSGCIGSTGLKLLTNHVNLKILELYVNDFQVFNSIVSSDVMKLRHLKKVILNFSSLKEIKKYHKLGINSRIEVNFNFYDVENEKDLDNSMELLSHINNGCSLMNRVTYVRSHFDPHLASKVCVLKNIVLGKVIVEDVNGREIYNSTEIQ